MSVNLRRASAKGVRRERRRFLVGARPTRQPLQPEATGANFGSIPHAELLKSVARRIVDRRVLSRRANLYMRRFVLGWKMLGLERSLGTRIVTYADDLVILCRRGKAEEALSRLREIMGKLKLTVNEDKTRICKVPEGEFDFLGYTFGRMYSARTGQARLGYRPSKKSIKRMVEQIHALTDRTGTWKEATELVGKLNRALASDQDVAGMSRGRNRRSRREDTHDRGAGQPTRQACPVR